MRAAGRVYAFEPVPQSAAAIEQSARPNRFDTICVFAEAVGPPPPPPPPPLSLSAHRPQVIYELDDARREGLAEGPGDRVVDGIDGLWVTILPASYANGDWHVEHVLAVRRANRVYPPGGAVGFDRGRLQTWAPAQRQPNYAVRRIPSRI